jgi:hypothetical protein
MFNPFRRKKKFPIHWLWLVTAAAVLAGVAAWVVVEVQWRMAEENGYRLTIAESNSQKLASELHDIKQYEGTQLGTSNCGPTVSAPLAQIGIYAGEASLAGQAVLDAMKKRDAAITMNDLSPVSSYTLEFTEPDNVRDVNVQRFPIRLADGGIAWVPRETVKYGDIYQVTFAADYLHRHADSLCVNQNARPEHSNCTPERLTLWNGGIYAGYYRENCGFDGIMQGDR